MFILNPVLIKRLLDVWSDFVTATITLGRHGWYG